MPTCPGCEQAVPYDRLPVHQRYCEGLHGGDRNPLAFERLEDRILVLGDRLERRIGNVEDEMQRRLPESDEPIARERLTQE